MLRVEILLDDLMETRKKNKTILLLGKLSFYTFIISIHI
jgi:hypothetical protein